jgi:hypothetical protein
MDPGKLAVKVNSIDWHYDCSADTYNRQNRNDGRWSRGEHEGPESKKHTEQRAHCYKYNVKSFERHGLR